MVLILIINYVLLSTFNGINTVKFFVATIYPLYIKGETLLKLTLKIYWQRMWRGDIASRESFI